MNLDEAVARLVAGRLVAFPTETVYGLGADASDAGAVAAIFRAKGRPTDHPLIVHLPYGGDPLQWASAVPEAATRLIDAYWPGPMTLIFPRRQAVGDAVAGGQDTIGLRCPSHPIAQALLRSYAAAVASTRPVGIAAPSANRFGRLSPTTAEHVRDEMADVADLLVVDGGDCAVGIESTIVDCSRLDTVGPVLLRPGAIAEAMLEQTLGTRLTKADRSAPRVSGALEAHYAPATPLRLVDARALAEAPIDAAVWSHSAHRSSSHPNWHVAPMHADRYAHALYGALRELDRSGAREIWVERPPATAAWAAINDRLMRAAAGSVAKT